MKILFETGSTCVGGAERVVLRLAQGLRRLRPDWQVDAVVLCERGGLEQEYQATFHHVWDGPGLDAYHLSGRAIAAMVKEHGYPIVHCIDSFHLTAAAAELCPQTHFVQNVFPNCRTSPFAPKQEWIDIQSRHYSAIVTEFKANLRYLNPPERPPCIRSAIPNGIDTAFWTPGDSARDIDVLWCARTDPEKGIYTAMELVPLLCGMGLNYWMVTSEPDGPQDILRQLALNYRTFQHLSRCNPDQLRALYRMSKVFLSTSKVEGMPATPLEAAACGCWPLVPKIDGLAEVFDHGTRRMWYDPETATPDSLAGEIAGMIFTPLAQGENWYLGDGDTVAREIACRYSVEAMVQGYLTLYNRLLETPL